MSQSLSTFWRDNKAVHQGQTMAIFAQLPKSGQKMEMFGKFSPIITVLKFPNEDGSDNLHVVLGGQSEPTQPAPPRNSP